MTASPVDVTAQDHDGISYLRRGDIGSTPIVLLHGIGSNANSFLPLMAALDGPRGKIAWNAPGYASSVQLDKPWPLPHDYAAAVIRLLDGLHIENCILVGHSLGALIAGSLATRWNDRLRALVLISAAHGTGIAPGSELPARIAARIDDLVRLGPMEFAKRRSPGLVANPAGRPDILAAVQAGMSAATRPGYDQACRMLASGRLLQDLATVTTPTLVLVGREDAVTPVEGAQAVFAALRNGSALNQYQEIEASGHAVCQEAPEAVARSISRFIVSIDAARNP